MADEIVTTPVALVLLSMHVGELDRRMAEEGEGGVAEAMVASYVNGARAALGAVMRAVADGEPTGAGAIFDATLEDFSTFCYMAMNTDMEVEEILGLMGKEDK